MSPATVETAEQPTGLEDVTRSLRALARTTRNLGESAAKVAERELAMAIDIAARLRDDVVAKDTLEDARRTDLAARLRTDAHQLVDVVVDAAAVLSLTTVRFFERFADERRPALSTGAGRPATLKS